MGDFSGDFGGDFSGGSGDFQYALKLRGLPWSATKRVRKFPIVIKISKF